MALATKNRYEGKFAFRKISFFDKPVSMVRVVKISPHAFYHVFHMLFINDLSVVPEATGRDFSVD